MSRTERQWAEPQRRFHFTPPISWWLACVVAAVFFGGLSSSASAAEAAEAEGTPYRISAEDVLHISVWKEQDLDKEVIVRPDGGISFPLAGDVHAAGKTPEQLQADLTKAIAKYIPDAVVTVSVAELKGLRLYVSGSVEKPGQYEVGRYIDVLQAITLAGGPTPFANTNDIKVIRREGDKQVVYPFNYNQVRKGHHLEQNIMLQADDVVVVP